MTQYSYIHNKQLLQSLMEKINVSDLQELSRLADVPKLQLIRLQRGLILSMSVNTINKIAKTLQVSVDRLIEMFVSQSTVIEPQLQPSQDISALEAYQQEYQRLKQEIEQQQQLLKTEFEQASLQTIESWLLQWPTAVAAVKKNPQLPAARLLSLVEPVEELLQQWGVEKIASVGEELPYDPQYHELMKGFAEVGEMVKVRYVGYKQRDKLLYKAKVSPIEAPQQPQ
jgi:molecular chaperone GrpE (heat shock protein)